MQSLLAAERLEEPFTRFAGSQFVDIPGLTITLPAANAAQTAALIASLSAILGR